MSVQEQINEYIASVPEEKRSDLQELHKTMLRMMSEVELSFHTGIDSNNKAVSNPNIGYGSQILKYADGSTREFYQVGFCATKAGISVYIIGVKDRAYLTETFGKDLGKAKVTGYCISFKTLKDINSNVLEAALRFGMTVREY